MKSTETQNQKHLIISYALGAIGLFGIGGLHRLYNGHKFIGILWLLTCGMGGIGQGIDMLLMPVIVAERKKLGLSGSLGINLDRVEQTIERAYETLSPNSQQKLMTELLAIAANNQGKITVTQAVLKTGKTFNDVEEALKISITKGYATIDNDPVTGAVIYHFHELV